jgi:hypothetical protein
MGTPFKSHELFLIALWRRSLFPLEQHTSFANLEKVYLR